MNLGIFLSIGDSLDEMEKSGQTDRFINLYLKSYIKNFKKVYLFSYGNEKWKLPKGVTLISNNSHLHRYLYALFLPLIHKKILKSCDVVRGFGLTSSVSSLLLQKILIGKKIPFVFNWAYDYFVFSKNEYRWTMAIVLKILEFISFKNAARVFIATNNKVKKLKGNKFIYLPNGVDTNLFMPRIDHNLAILYVGRLEKQKNLYFLINSIALLPPKYRKITFLGSGSLKVKLQDSARDKNVNLTIHEPIKNSLLPNFMSAFSIFALPSHIEGSPKALLEAMAAGLVPVVSNFETAPDIITNGKDGFVVNFKKKDFAAKIHNLLEDGNLRKTLSKNANSKISKEFNISHLINKEIGILKNAK